MKLHLKLPLSLFLLTVATIVPAGAQQDTAHMPFMNPQLAPVERATGPGSSYDVGGKSFGDAEQLCRRAAP